MLNWPVGSESPMLTGQEYARAVLALQQLPDRCAASVGELADRIGADKLLLIQWSRTDVECARLIASKVAR